MARPKSLVCGVGVNDADYFVERSSDGSRSACAIYVKWKDMLSRCYSKKYQERNPSYKECYTASGWLLFSNFKSWVDSQDWQGKELDKDILFVGNKVYSPETCVFVDRIVNTFIVDRSSANLGFYLNKKLGKLQSQCRNPFTLRNEFVGLFSTPEDAHQAWRKRKHELSCQLADLQTDQRVAGALRARYA